MHCPIPTKGVCGAKIHFSEYGHVAYQITENDACSNMVANILPVDTPMAPRAGSKGLCLKVAMLHIKGMEKRVPCKHILCPYTHPRPPGLGQNVRKNSERNHVAYQIKGNGA